MEDVEGVRIVDDCIRCNQYHLLAGLSVEDLSACDRDLPVCVTCIDKLSPAQEAMRYCPVDGCEMKKLVIYDVVLIDKCYGCGGVWLDDQELQVIEKVVAVNAALGGYMLGEMAEQNAARRA